ncbi:MAG: class I SAM-dependent methyltransferase, partial [Thermodesulfobacteriota bacterium]
LIEWYKNFKNNWNSLKTNYNKNFYRMWEYYLLSCAAAFRARKVQLWQIVLSPEGFPGGYQAVR